jgi:hypothetical protein
MRGHDQPDDFFHPGGAHFGQDILDVRMPVAHSDQHAELSTQRGLERFGLGLGLLQDGRTPADFTVAFADFMNNFR